MKVWVTRTQPGAGRTADRLRALGHEPLLVPVLETHPVPGRIVLTGLAALAFTSVNAVEAFAERERGRDLPVFAVGASTAAAATSAGFGHVRSAGGDVRALAALIAATSPPGEVLHVAGRPLAGDLVGALQGAGLRTRMVVLYETRPTGSGPPLEADVVLVHSPHAARVLAEGLKSSPRWRSAPVLAISKAAAEPLRSAGFTCVRWADRPDEAALLDCLTAFGRRLTSAAPPAL
jgi:uroporphyrinogen-III synthase